MMMRVKPNQEKKLGRLKLMWKKLKKRNHSQILKMLEDAGNLPEYEER